MKSYFSNGKLLLTGEYAVLDSALSLAVPTKMGQHLTVKHQESNDSQCTLKWTSLDYKGQTWYSEMFKISGDNFNFNRKIQLTKTANKLNSVTDKIIQILEKAMELNPEFLLQGAYHVETKLDFLHTWGLGSSSTLICNIAKWAQVDAFKLSDASFGGSGYDIAVGMMGGDILYRSPSLWEGYVYNPSFKDQLYLVHLNKKQNSRKGIANYKSKTVTQEDLDKISNLTELISVCNDFVEFQELITDHENIISSIIQMKKVKDNLFVDYPFAIKSLGAWGGDFILACGDDSTPEYFTSKGFKTVLKYSEIIK